MREAALRLHEEGCVVVPVGLDKVPLVPWLRWYDRAQTRRHVHQYWNAHPDAGVAIVLGKPSGLVVLDVELPAFGAGVLDNVLIPMTPTARSRSGGRHFYFKYDAALFTRNWSLGNLHVGELRGDRSLVVAPPTTGYSWIHSPFEVELNEPPYHVARCIEADRQRHSVPSSFVGGRGVVGTRGSRSEEDFAIAMRMALAGFDADEVRAVVEAGEKARDKSARDRQAYAARTAAKARMLVDENSATVRVSAMRWERDAVVLRLDVLSGSHVGRTLRVRVPLGVEHEIESSLAWSGCSAKRIRTNLLLRARLGGNDKGIFVNDLVLPRKSGASR